MKTLKMKAWGDYLADNLVAASLTLGFAEVIFLARGLEPAWGLSIAGSLAICALYLLLSRRWWIVPAVIATGGLFLGWVFWQTDLGPDLIKPWPPFFRWVSDRLLLGGPEPDLPIWLPGLRLLILGGIALPVLVLVRRWNSLLTFMILALLVDLPFLIRYPSGLAAIMPTLAGLIMLLPASLIRAVRKAQPTAALPRAPMQLLAAPVAVLCILAGLYLTPADTSHWRQQDWINRLSDWRDAWLNQGGSGRSWQPFNLAYAGFPSTETQLGGPVIQSDLVYFQVYASQPYLLRGVTRDIYTGRSWQSSSRQVYRFDSPLWWLVKRQVFAEGQPSGDDGLAFATAFRQNVQIGVNPQTWRQSSLFTAGQVERIVWNQESPPPVYFTGDGDLFVFDGFSGAQEYTLTTAVWNRGQPGFAQALAEMAAQPERARDPYWPGIRERYLQVPDQLPDLVSETARLVAADAENPYEQALLLEAYLQTRFIYSLKAELPPGDMDFVAYFLQSRTGYCVHFATAMTIMARTLGIPARYAEGFALEPGKAAGIFLATGKTAHAWTELYFRGIGWLTFDPTATDRPDPTDEPTDPNQETPTPAPTLTPVPTQPPAGPEDTPGKSANLLWLYILAGAALLAACLRLLVLVLEKRHLSRLQPDTIRLRWPRQTICLEKVYQDLLHQLACLDLQPETGETMQQFAERAEKHLRLAAHNLPDVLWPVARWRYGGHKPQTSELERLLELHERLESRLRESLSHSAWFWRRVLHRW